MKKTILKTGSYAAVHLVVTVGVSYALSGRWQVALAIGMVEPCAQIFAFFFHEQAWHAFDRKKAKQAGTINDNAPSVAEAIEKVLTHRH